MKVSINSKKLQRKVTFTTTGVDGGYVFVDLNGGEPGCLGSQICKFGRLTGSTIEVGDIGETKFKNICRNWLRDYCKKHDFLFVGNEV